VDDTANCIRMLVGYRVVYCGKATKKTSDSILLGYEHNGQQNISVNRGEQSQYIAYKGIVGGRTSARRKGPYRTSLHWNRQARQKHKAEQKKRTKSYVQA
jgi:hypothetical protein